MSTETVEYNGVSYRRVGSGWVDEHFVKAPLVIGQELDRLHGRSATSQTTAPSAPRKTNQKMKQGLAFTGLQATDFKNNVAGTSWRRKASLGGLIAQRLNDRTGREFKSRSVQRRPQVLFGQPPRFDPQNQQDFNLPKAKFQFRLDEQGGIASFYIERPNYPMDIKWEWPAFVEALSGPRTVYALDSAFQQHAFQWRIEYFAHRESYKPLGAVKITKPTDWSAIAQTLGQFSSDYWYDVEILCRIPGDQAISAGVQVVDLIVEPLLSLLPLYDACERSTL